MIALTKDQQSGELGRDFMPDLTPMIDILFILIVFFLLTIAPNFRILDLQLPVDNNAAIAKHEARLLLEITTDYYALDGQRLMTLAALKEALAVAVRERPQQPLLIATDRQLSMQRLLPVLSELQSQGIVAASILLRGEQDQ